MPGQLQNSNWSTGAEALLPPLQVNLILFLLKEKANKLVFTVGVDKSP